MGREKDRLIEEEERGWFSVSTSNVCDDCVRNEGLQEFIRNDGQKVECDYCGSTPDEAYIRCVDFDTLMERIGECIFENFNDADSEAIPYDSGEGGYQFDTFDTYDLITDVMGLDRRARRD